MGRQHLMPSRNDEFSENYSCTLKPHDILKVKNVFVKSVPRHRTHYIIIIIIPKEW